MIIIADCGATKSEWRVLHSDGTTSQHRAGGINASTMASEKILEIVSKISSAISATDCSAAEIHLYIAGLADKELKENIHNCFLANFAVSSFEIQNDLIAAARAVCGHKPGIAAIIGTGSNSCAWDGEKIVDQVYSGGFILGDEGSAAALGRIFISDFLKRMVPEEIALEFSRRYPARYTDIISNIYNSKESPSGYLGSFAPFIVGYYSHPYVKRIVDENFRAFFRRSIRQYGIPQAQIGIVGGFAHALKDIIIRIAQEEHVEITQIQPQPIEGLIEYHRQTPVL